MQHLLRNKMYNGSTEVTTGRRKMKYRLGLDMGTNSIGFSIIELSKENYPVDLVDMGVRVFRDGRNPKDKQPLALARRMARGLRRQRDRRLQRKRQILRALIDNRLFPLSEEERQNLKHLDPFTLRKEALDRQLSDYELGRALFHLGSRRGFKSNRITDSDENNETTSSSKKMTQADKISNLSVDMKEAGARTVGEYLYFRIKDGCGARFRGGDFNCYPSREHYIDEFNAIRQIQSKTHPDVDWDAIYSAIFFQRPLRKQERGKCRFYTDKDRAYSALPSAQRFRILSEINNLKFTDSDGNIMNLSNDEKDRLFEALDNCRTMSFTKVRQILKMSPSCKFNLEDDRRDKLLGNETSFAMRKPELFGALWDEMDIKAQDEIIDLLLEAETDEEVLERLAVYGLTEEQKTNILKVKLGRKVGSLSAEFMRDCSEIMKDRHVRYDEAVTEMDLHHSYNPITELQESLPYYGKVLYQTVTGAHPEANDDNPEFKYGKIANPTVHIALNQLRKVVNSIIDHYGKPEQIVVELSRDISESAEKRSEHYREQAQKEKENERIREQMRELGIPKPTAWDVKKYKLWEELGKDSNVRKCPYCGKPIPGNKIFTKEIEIEHILPYSRTMLDSMSNLTIAHAHCNLKKSNLTPYEAFSSNPEGYEWQEIMQRIQNLPAEKRAKFSKDAAARFDEGEGFIARQLNDNRYISKAARDYLACICPANHIWGIPGYNTAYLRSRWGLNLILNRNGDPYFKNRSDHRHHSIDALVIGLTDRGMIKEMADLNKAYDSVARMNVPPFPFDLDRVRYLLKNMLVSYKPDHGYQSRFFKETATGLKYVKTRIKVSDLTEAQIKEDLIFNKEISKNLNSLLTSRPFRSVKKALLEKAKETQKSDEPEIDVFKKVWVTRVNLVDLDEKDIEDKRIFNPRIMKYIVDNTRDVISDKKALKTRLEELSSRTGIKRIRYVPKTQEFARINSVPNKWYERDGVCFVSIWSIPQKGKDPKYQGQFISYQEAYDHESGKLKEYPKPHPAAKKLMTIYKDDVIRICPKDGSSPYYAVCSGFATKGNKMDIQPLMSAESIGSWIDKTNVEIISDYGRWFDKSNGQNFVSINSLLKDNMITVIKVSPDGRIEHQ